MSTGYRPDCFTSEPKWYLNGSVMTNSKALEILGVSFRTNSVYDHHVQNRIQKCRRSLYSLGNVGMCYPGLNTSSKVTLYKTICLPTLMYSMGAVNLVKRDLIKLESFQGSVLKQVCGIGNRSHHTRLVRALSIDSISTAVRNHSSTLFKRICSVDSPTQQLCFYMLSDYILNKNLVPGSLALLTLVYHPLM